MLRRFLFTLALLAACASQALAARHTSDGKLDGALRQRAHTPRGASRVIIQTTDGGPVDGLIKSLRGKPGRRLRLLGAQVAEVPDASLDSLANLSRVRAISLDRPVHGAMERTGATIGTTWVRENLGYDGSGIGVAIIDSGVVAAHDDLGPDRVAHFADFVNYQPNAYDDYGHGTHVAGIIGGNGYDSTGARRGIAPGASLVVLKVLDGAGNGYISSVIAALDYAVSTRATYNTRVINLSVAAGVYESYNTDPLTLAAKRAVESGLVVVTAAGNLGRNATGNTQYGAITAPGNAPWVLTVGASSHMGTVDRSDDTIATFSSRGPSYIDYAAKPDIVAPGVGIESLTEATTLLYQTRPAARLWGTVQTATEPYLSMSGTSMAAPVVTGTVALLLQANPALTPNAVKAILQFTAETRDGWNYLTQGAGFLNARGAVDLAAHFAGTLTAPIVIEPSYSNDGDAVLNAPTASTTTQGTVSGASLESGETFTIVASSPTDETAWSRHIIWGNHLLTGGMIQPDATAWNLDVTWGAARTAAGTFVDWGTVCDPARDPECEDIVWGSSTCDPNDPTTSTNPDCENIVWGTSCDATDPNASTNPDCENIVWGTAGNFNIVWGTACAGENCEDIVWGSQECDPNRPADECENIVWGTDECDPSVPPEECENIVWGTSCDPATNPDCDIFVWGTRSLNPGDGQTCGNKPRR